MVDDSVIVEQARNVEALSNHVEEEVRNIFVGNGSRKAS